MDITKVDKNLAVEATIKKDGLAFYDINNAPFKIYGVYLDDGKYRRLPEAVATATSKFVHYLHAQTAGGRVRFETNSKVIAISAKMPNYGQMPHFAMTGSAGFDLYIREEGDTAEHYANAFVPPLEVGQGYDSKLTLENSKMREITIHFPLYSEVSSLLIGLEEGSRLEEAEPYRVEKPVVYYGSSITQGGCASRPGNSYQSMVSRRLNINYVNLGFSGSAKAEPEMVEYIRNLDMSVFVLDYDHNAPTVEHLQNTHETMFRAVRQSNPDLPVVMMSRPAYRPVGEEQQRLEIVRQTYLNAKAAGDNNVYFIDGPTLMAMAGYDGKVDQYHPNDLGFASMAKAVGDVLEKLL